MNKNIRELRESFYEFKQKKRKRKQQHLKIENKEFF